MQSERYVFNTKCVNSAKFNPALQSSLHNAWAGDDSLRKHSHKTPQIEQITPQTYKTHLKFTVNHKTILKYTIY